MIRTILSLGMIVFAVSMVSMGTVAFFSDTETSTDNTFAAGDIDLLIDNESYYNGNLNENTSWDLVDLTIERFFDFDDVKPNDYGEDTISLHVDTNDAYICADVMLTSNDDNGINDPEEDAGDTTDGPGEGELADLMNFMWWADDGDNVFEDDENIISQGPIGALEIGVPYNLALADSDENIWTGVPGPVQGDETLYIGKAWCFGDITPQALPQDGEIDDWDPSMDNDNIGGAGQPADGGFLCDGSLLGNESQTDSLTADVSFEAVQARHNDGFQCSEEDLGCRGALDIMLVMDNSTSIDDGEETTMQAAGVAFMTAIGISTDGSHAGLVSFEYDSTLSQELTGDLASINAAINDPFGSGSTNLASGIEAATTELMSDRDRDDLVFNDVMVILTDGNPNYPGGSGDAEPAAIVAADAARAAGIEVYVVGVGGDVDETFLENEIADDANHYFSSANFDDLEEVLVGLANCDDLPNGDGNNGDDTPTVTALFFDNFGAGNTDSTFDEDPVWEEGGAGAEKRNSAGGGDESISDGDGGRKAAMAGPDGWICRSIDATGFAALSLSYSWRGDSDAEAGDEGLVEYATGGTCAAPTGLTNIATHPLTTTSWTSNSGVDLSTLDGTSFLLRFRTNSDAVGEDFRVDAVTLSGLSS